MGGRLTTQQRMIAALRLERDAALEMVRAMDAGACFFQAPGDAIDASLQDITRRKRDEFISMAFAKQRAVNELELQLRQQKRLTHANQQL